MLVFNSIRCHHVSDYGSEVSKYLREKFENAVVFATIDDFISCINEELIEIHIKYPRCKHFFARAIENRLMKYHYAIYVDNGRNKCCTMIVTNVFEAYYYNSKNGVLKYADRGFGVITEDK